VSIKFENRQPPEGINVSKVNPFAQFLKLLVASLLLIVLVVVALQFLGGALAKHVPFKYEERLVENFEAEFGSAGASPELVAYLNELADRVAPGLELTEGISVNVHYRDESVFNAFATIGGNLFFYRGLLEEMPHENALAMVMAHEMAHINHRDPIVGLGGGLASVAAISMLTGQNSIAGGFFSQAGMMTNTQFTRSMETSADEAALAAVNQLYGHVNGAGALFVIMGGISGDNEAVPDWLERFAATHPLSTDRVKAVKQLAADNLWSQEGELTPLPDEFDQWLAGATQ